MYAKAIEAGVDIVDTAVRFNGWFNITTKCKYFILCNERILNVKPYVNIDAFEKLSYYWEDVRKYYQDFESGMIAPHSEVYRT